MTRHWLKGGPEPDVFNDAQNLIGASGFRIRSSASYASAVYSGVFCLLALRNARDWRRGEDIRLQDLQDHHIFPRAYLLRHGIAKRVDVNSIANRTLISDQTNGTIKANAPAAYLRDADVFPSGVTGDLLKPHFIDDGTTALLEDATEQLSDTEVSELFGRFVQAREAAMIQEIRRVCGTRAGVAEADSAVDEPAADIDAGGGPADELDEELELEAV